MTKRKQTIYLDCTATYYLGINTGIQRVVRNIIKRAPDIGRELGVDCVPVVSRFNRFWTSQEFRQLRTSSEITSTLVNKGASLAAKLSAHEGRIITKAQHFGPWIVYAYMISALRRLLRYAAYTSLQMPFIKRLLIGKVRTIKPRPGDIILMTDSFWAYDVLSPLERMNLDGVCVVPLIYDLIPLNHPEYSAEGVIRAFRRLLPVFARKASGFICISHSTKNDLINYFHSHHMAREQNLPVEAWYLGADLIEEHRDTHLPIRSEVKQLCNDPEIYLMVGTIEPRKGHDTAFRAMTELWDAGSTKKLVIVGRIGWLCDELVTAMNSSPYLGKYLYLFHDANDAELDYLYRHSFALIFASKVEGFGLPLVEALQRGLPTIASDIPVFREIGGNLVHYFKHGDIDDLITVITSSTGWPATQENRQPLGSWITWDESTRDLLNKTIAISQRRCSSL